MWSATILLAAIVAGCGGSSGDGVAVVVPGPAAIGAICTGTGCVNLGTAANYAILAKTGVDYTPIATVSSTPTIIGNIGVSPTGASSITGFALTLPAGGAYSTSTLVTGAIYAPGYAAPTPANLTTAIGDMENAYTTANLMAQAGGGNPATGGTACPGNGALSGQTLTPGVYTCTTALSMASTAVTLNGAGVYVIRTTQAFTTTGSGVKVILSGGALAQNVFWVVGGDTTISANAQIAGNILDKTAINMGNLSSISGRLLSQTAVNLNATTVTQP